MVHCQRDDKQLPRFRASIHRFPSLFLLRGLRAARVADAFSRRLSAGADSTEPRAPKHSPGILEIVHLIVESVTTLPPAISTELGYPQSRFGASSASTMLFELARFCRPR